MTASHRLVQRTDGTAKMTKTKSKYNRPKPLPCPDCGSIMGVVSEPAAHYVCKSPLGCGITRDIHPDTGEMLDKPFNPDYIGDIEIDDWD